jgi:hypothetical protein
MCEMPKVTAKQAEDIRAAIEKRFAAHVHPGKWGSPQIFPPSHENLSDGAWVISWEEGPYDWAIDPFGEVMDWETFYALFDGGEAPEVASRAAKMAAIPQPHAANVFIEPINSFTLGLYPA